MQSRTTLSRERPQWVLPLPLTGMSSRRTTCCALTDSKWPNPQRHRPIQLMVMTHLKIQTTRRSVRYLPTAVTNRPFQRRWHPSDCLPRETSRFPIRIWIVDLVIIMAQVPLQYQVNLVRVDLVLPEADTVKWEQDVAVLAVHWEFLSMDPIMPAESTIRPRM